MHSDNSERRLPNGDSSERELAVRACHLRWAPAVSAHNRPQRWCGLPNAIHLNAQSAAAAARYRGARPLTLKLEQVIGIQSAGLHMGRNDLSGSIGHKQTQTCEKAPMQTTEGPPPSRRTGSLLAAMGIRTALAERYGAMVVSASERSVVSLCRRR